MNTFCFSNFNNFLRAAGLDAERRNSKVGTWNSVLEQASYVPVSYKEQILDYEKVYLSESVDQFFDLSIIINWQGKPVAVWPISLSISQSDAKFGSFGGAVVPPIFIDTISLNAVKSITKACLKFSDIICRACDINSWKSYIQYLAMDSRGLPRWYLEAMAAGATSSIRHALYVDLSLDLAEYRKRLRKSYKTLVSSGPKHWNVGILDGNGENIWEQFQALHLEVAGRTTRPQKTWDLQYEAILNENAILIYLTDKSKKMVGGGYFTFSDTEVNYSVAAYDRNLFSKPLGHIVQYSLVGEMMKRGKKWYRLGNMPYLNDQPKPTDKELSIANFKSGFATHVFPEYSLIHTVNCL